MSAYLFAVFASLFGLAIGSFLNVVIDRLPAGRSLARGRSQCDSCGTPLAPRDLVPVVSYLLLRGGCRFCRERIPRRIPLVELANAGLYLFIAWRYGVAPEAFILMAFASILVAIFVIDLERRLILNAITYPGAALALAAAPWGPVGQGLLPLKDSYLDALLGLLLGGGVLLLISLVAYRLLKREAMGLGDVKLGVLMGAMLGFAPTLVALDLSFITGGVVGAGLWLAKVRRPGDYLPFGPFLAVAALVSLFWGHAIVAWYGSLFG
ncbi:MAG: prepilin peptidase [Chloroflexi bacterium]|nr:prepilin peptidase [Chloroflexota bacterium]